MQYTMKDGTPYIIREALTSEIHDAMDLAFKVFLKYEAEEYGEEGTKNFIDFITSPDIIKMHAAGFYKIFIAVTGDEQIVGIGSLRSGNHISLLFVKDKYHRQGVARNLINTLRKYLSENTKYVKMTVNASPYGVPFYETCGFEATDEMQHKDGIIYLPMELYL